MRSLLFLPALAVSLLALTARAHDPGFSTAIVTVGAREIEAVVTYSLGEIQGDPARVPTAAFQVNEQTPGAPSHETKGEDANIVYRVVSPRPADGLVTLAAPLIERLAPGHRQHLLVRDEEKAALLNQFLLRGQSSATLTLPPLPATETRLDPILVFCLEILAFAIALWVIILRTPSARIGKPRTT